MIRWDVFLLYILTSCVSTFISIGVLSDFIPKCLILPNDADRLKVIPPGDDVRFPITDEWGVIEVRASRARRSTLLRPSRARRPTLLRPSRPRRSTLLMKVCAQVFASLRHIHDEAQFGAPRLLSLTESYGRAIEARVYAEADRGWRYTFSRT